MTKVAARGLRNNNPGNIRLSASKYLGEIRPSADAAFRQFESMAWGYRAMFVVLYTYHVRHGCKTSRQMIARYAPPCENHTSQYVDSVARWSGIDPDTPVEVTDRETMSALVAAMSRMENGVAAVAEDVEQGWRLFILHKP